MVSNKYNTKKGTFRGFKATVLTKGSERNIFLEDTIKTEHGFFPFIFATDEETNGKFYNILVGDTPNNHPLRNYANSDSLELACNIVMEQEKTNKKKQQVNEITAIKNHSMLEELSLNDEEIVLKGFTRQKEECYTTVGHIYSVIVELLDIEKPDINRFIEELNNQDIISKITSPSDKLSEGALNALSGVLYEKRLKNKDYNIIMKEAQGGYDFVSYSIHENERFFTFEEDSPLTNKTIPKKITSGFSIKDEKIAFKEN